LRQMFCIRLTRHVNFSADREDAASFYGEVTV
jgi:hypothetical protein